MKNKQINKTLIGRTGKDLLNLINTKNKNITITDIEPPQGETETALYNFWKILLGFDDFGRNQDFFKTGGNSLKAIHLVSFISREFEVRVELNDIFYNPTLSGLAAFIDKRKSEKSSAPQVAIQQRSNALPLSYSQERLWFIDKFEGSKAYHIHSILKLEGSLNKDALQNALQTVVNRHEILRTVVVEQDGQPVQEIKAPGNWNLQMVDHLGLNEDQLTLHHYLQTLIQQPFDLSSDDMLRGTLVQTGANNHYLVLVMHHIASDAWSLSVLVSEIVELYEAYIQGIQADLNRLDVQYADYATWQRTYMNGEVYDQKLGYWKQQLANVEPLNLTLDFNRPAQRTTNGSKFKFKFAPGAAEKLGVLAAN